MDFSESLHSRPHESTPVSHAKRKPTMMGMSLTMPFFHSHRHEATPVVENNSLHSLKPSEAQKSGKEISVSKSLHSHRHESMPVVENNIRHGLTQMRPKSQERKWIVQSHCKDIVTNLRQ